MLAGCRRWHDTSEAHLRRLAASFGDAVSWHEPLDKRDLYRLLGGAGLVLYPTPQPGGPSFAETSCIAAMEAMACGAVWISTDAGALPQTVGDGGVLVPLGEVLTDALRALGLNAPGAKALVYGFLLMGIIAATPSGLWPWLAAKLGLQERSE